MSNASVKDKILFTLPKVGDIITMRMSGPMNPNYEGFMGKVKYIVDEHNVEVESIKSHVYGAGWVSTFLLSKNYWGYVPQLTDWDN